MQTLVNRDLGEPNSLTVDLFNYEVCWADAGSQLRSISPRIDCVGLNGGGRRSVLALDMEDVPYGITVTDNNIMWTDWNKLVCIIG